MIKPKQPEAKTKQSKPKKFSEIPKAKTSGHKNSSTPDKKTTKNIKEPFWILIRQWLIVALTGTLAFYTYKLYESTAKSVEITNKSLAIADTSIAITKQLAKTQEKFARIENRAYLNIKNIGFIIPQTDSIIVDLNIFNSGKTPAMRVFEVIFITNIETDLPRHAKEIRGIVSTRSNQGRIIGANMSIDKKVHGPFVTPENFSLFSSGKSKLYIIGLIGYTDIFKTRHHTWFCFNITPNGTYRAYHKYNEAD